MAYMEDSLHLTLDQIIPLMQQRIMNESTYFGVQTWKSPIDFWIYQEMLYELKPDVIVEIGNNCGGSTLALAHICDLLGNGRVIGIDLSHSTVAPESQSSPSHHSDRGRRLRELRSRFEANHTRRQRTRHRRQLTHTRKHSLGIGNIFSAD